MECLNEYFKNQSLITNKQAEKIGINRSKLAQLTKKGKLERVKNGVYKKKGDINDDFALISLNNEKVIFSFHTALFLLGLSDRSPNVFHISVPQGYNVSHLKKLKKKIRVHYIKIENFDIGVTLVITPIGNEVQCYDMERSICDIVLERDTIDKQVFTDAITRYFNNKEKNLRNLIKYSRKLGIENEIRKYIEVL
ncbi:type IV toxin-antitoxin system AbiEi family antitoxin domain-containing protein [Lagierella sp.]|uniref:type IV toxin-antitoxin system AbiEi family antitoxin domain-containing protein n=1 Tax=Lagierella sp. TaxID=2849657 RepID=UPI0026208237|nr:type IV toxin-antitoxin system AbiEi family antitoxin domain-containing protein [Lagierella sp.]